MPEGGITPVFESGIETGNRIVARTFFDFTADLTWQRASSTSDVFTITDKTVTNETMLPRITANAQNNSLKTLFNVQFIATVFDADGNTLATSATMVDRIAPNEVAQLTFTWPEAFPANAGRVDIVPILPVPPLK